MTAGSFVPEPGVAAGRGIPVTDASQQGLRGGRQHRGGRRRRDSDRERAGVAVHVREATGDG